MDLYTESFVLGLVLVKCQLKRTRGVKTRFCCTTRQDPAGNRGKLGDIVTTRMRCLLCETDTVLCEFFRHYAVRPCWLNHVRMLTTWLCLYINVSRIKGLRAHNTERIRETIPLDKSNKGRKSLFLWTLSNSRCDLLLFSDRRQP